MKKTALSLIALVGSLLLTSCGASTTSTSSTPAPGWLTNSAVRPIQSYELKNLKYSLKADLDFTQGEKKKVKMFRGRREASEEISLSFSFVSQKRVSAAEAEETLSACTFSTFPQGDRAPIFHRTAVLEVADFGVLTTSESSSFQMLLKEEIGKSLKLRCRNVINRAELEAQIGHLLRIDN